jgi:acyl-CoA synthetase (AMP-forming)/AMP-acid ligase II
MDDAGAVLPPGATGEICVRGDLVMKGYYKDPAKTAETIVDGWLHTGDIGRWRPDGNLVITDRKKDMFIVGGFNAYPAEIENLMLAHPAVGQVAVIGIPDARLGEVGMAFVIPRPGTTPDPEEIIAWCRKEMANYKVPRAVEIVEGLPLNASGKVLKFQLRERAAGRAATP